MTVGQRVKAARLKAGLTQRGMAEMFDITSTAICHIEADRTKTSKTAKRILDHFENPDSPPIKYGIGNCKECQCYHPHQWDGSRGACKRYPPLVPWRGTQGWAQPCVRCDDRCFEFRRVQIPPKEDSEVQCTTPNRSGQK